VCGNETEFRTTLFKPERFHRQVDELAAVIRPAIKLAGLRKGKREKGEGKRKK
jgi:hypothetical protein